MSKLSRRGRVEGLPARRAHARLSKRLVGYDAGQLTTAQLIEDRAAARLCLAIFYAEDESLRQAWTCVVEEATSELEGRSAAAQAEREAARRARLATRPEQQQVSSGRSCAACQRKPARIDDYCKKCAREAGIVVHGKIGDGE